jgi:hypothetical protein
MEPESSIAKLRNKLQPMVTYFALKKMLDKNEVASEHREYMSKLVEEQYNYIQKNYMDDLLTFVKDDSKWTDLKTETTENTCGTSESTLFDYQEANSQYTMAWRQ